MVPMADTGAQLRWTADSSSASEAAAILWWKTFAPRLPWSLLRLWAFSTVAILLAVALDGEASGSWAYAVVHGAALALVIGVVVTGSGWWHVLRRFKRELATGTELTALWDAEHVTFGSPHTEVRMPLSTIDSVRVLQFWVIVHRRAERTQAIWPRELFPDSVLDRLPVAAA